MPGTGSVCSPITSKAGIPRGGTPCSSLLKQHTLVNIQLNMITSLILTFLHYYLSEWVAYIVFFKLSLSLPLPFCPAFNCEINYIILLNNCFAEYIGAANIVRRPCSDFTAPYILSFYYYCYYYYYMSHISR